MQRLGPPHDAADEAGQSGQLIPRISVREKLADLGPVRQGDGLVVTGDRDVE